MEHLVTHIVIKLTFLNMKVRLPNTHEETAVRCLQTTQLRTVFPTKAPLYSTKTLTFWIWAATLAVTSEELPDRSDTTPISSSVKWQSTTSMIVCLLEVWTDLTFSKLLNRLMVSWTATTSTPVLEPRHNLTSILLLVLQVSCLRILTLGCPRQRTRICITWTRTNQTSRTRTQRWQVRRTADMRAFTNERTAMAKDCNNRQLKCPLRLQTRTNKQLSIRMALHLQA